MHTLYSRGACPLLASETIRLHQQHEQSNKRATPMERKFIKFGASLGHLIQEWSLLCSYANIKRMLITLGPSWSRSREFYILDFDDCCDETNNNAIHHEIMDPDIKQEHALSRRLTRVLLDGISNNDVSGLSHSSPHGSSYIVHLSVWIQQQEAERLFERAHQWRVHLQPCCNRVFVDQAFPLAAKHDSMSWLPKYPPVMKGAVTGRLERRWWCMAKHANVTKWVSGVRIIL